MVLQALPGVPRQDRPAQARLQGAACPITPLPGEPFSTKCSCGRPRPRCTNTVRKRVPFQILHGNRKALQR
jgi:hypothetical protein